MRNLLLTALVLLSTFTALKSQSVSDTITDYFDRASAYFVGEESGFGYYGGPNSKHSQIGMHYSSLGSPFRVTELMIFFGKKEVMGAGPDSLPLRVFASTSDTLPGILLSEGKVSVSDMDTTGFPTFVSLEAYASWCGDILIVADFSGMDDTVAIIITNPDSAFFMGDGNGEKRARAKETVSGEWVAMEDHYFFGSAEFDADILVLPVIWYEYICGGVSVTGNVYKDENGNCNQDLGEPSLPFFRVMATPGPYITLTDASGTYQFFLDSTAYTLSVDLPPGVPYIPTCPPPGTVVVDLTSGTSIDSVNLGLDALYDCPDLRVNIGTWRHRPCFVSPFTVDYCNMGTDTAFAAFIEVELDPHFTFVSSSGPAPTMVAGKLRFDLGDLSVAECGWFNFEAMLDCDLGLSGFTLCTEAHIYPDSACIPPSGSWDGSSVVVSSECKDDTLSCFKLRNNGIGDMATNSEFRIYEDGVIVHNDSFSLDLGDSLVVCWASLNGSVVLQADQVSGHPFESTPTALVEGCNTLGEPGEGMAMPMDDHEDFVSIFCMEVTNSFDPNDKQAFPVGADETFHYIDSTQSIDYLIRFQNTGSDTAYNVMIEDVLDPALDPASVQILSHSHPVEFRIDPGSVVILTFPEIYLPDSSTDEPNSHGFVSFRVNQLPGNIDGTTIENTAGIYFDFNPPVITNTCFHTIGEATLTLSEVPMSSLYLEVWPNPASEKVSIKSPMASLSTISIYDPVGRLYHESYLQPSGTAEISTGSWPSGIYFIHLASETSNGIIALLSVTH